MKVSLIVATSKNFVIGKNNKLIWKLPKDMNFFKTTTTGSPVIMGRKNFESIPEKFRPLKNRTNIVITRNMNFYAKGCVIVDSIESSLKSIKQNTKEVFVIGGGEIYKHFLDLNLIDRMYITHINENFEGDTFFPKIDLERWNSKTIMKNYKDKLNPHNFEIIKYDKIN